MPKKKKRSYPLIPTRREPREGREASGKAFLIVAEGRATEPQYFTGLRNKLELPAAHVEVVHPGVTDPRNIVKEAIRLRDERAAAAARKGAMTVPYDEVWVVFDREAQNHPRGQQLPEARTEAEAENIKVALSNPCFEFWFILHFELTTGALADGKKALAALKKHLPDYGKSDLQLEVLLEKGRMSKAVKHARHCRKHHKECRGDGNPSTDVDLLVIELNDSAPLQFRLLTD